MFRGILGLLFVLFFVNQSVLAQEIEPKGLFLEDTIKIGTPVGYSLSLKYPKELDVVFPDSLYDFSPYEIDHKEYFPTKSDSTHSYDSAVYYFLSFEIDSIQTLKLPVFILHSKDSTTVNSNTDSIILDQLVEEVPDSVAIEALPLKENTTYKNVDTQFNYPVLILILGILIVAITIFLIIFGGKIRQNFGIRRMRKSYQKFVASYDQIIADSATAPTAKAEKALITWKRYLEGLERRPYTKLTTKEIIKWYKVEGIEESLKTIDRAIYSKQSTEELMPAYTSLKKYAHDRFNQKVEEVKNDR